MFTFEDTKLLRHPTVERAYNEMRKFFADGDDFAQEAVRAGEIMSARCKSPDPDAIAAAVLMDGMIVRYQSSSFAATVSPRAAEILENMYAFDPEKPEFKSAAEQQIILAHSIIGLEQVYAKIKSGELSSGMEYQNVTRALEANEKVLLKVIENAAEGEMAVAAVEQLLITKSALDDVVRRTQASFAFEKTGLPDHPLVREVYDHMKNWNLAAHPLGGYVETNAAVAKVIVETGASSDPEVISAALLNQYSQLHDGKEPSEFSPRIGALWAETSAWASMGSKQPEPERTEEGNIIRHAAHLHFLERTLESFETPRRDIAADDLEYLEDLKDYVSKDLKDQQHPALKTRMETAVALSDRIMNQPDNFQIRKPGSPRQDPGW
jgi:hypothetical protein